MNAALLSREVIGEVVARALPAISGPIVGDHPPVSNGPPTAQEIAEQCARAAQRAYDEAYARAYADAQAKIEREAARLRGICAQLGAPLAEVDDAVIEAVGELSILIARQLIRRELKHSPGEVVAVVREAMRQLPLATRRARIHLHPDDLLLVQEALAVRADTAWQLEGDPLIARGGCIVETEVSRIDAQVESRITAVASKMFGNERGSERDA